MRSPRTRGVRLITRRICAKLYLCGNLHRVRSSRRLEAEAARNLEVVWLLRGVRPDFKTIADFRRDNRAAFKPLFKHFNLLCRARHRPGLGSRHTRGRKRSILRY